jgi:hypothetical protein
MPVRIYCKCGAEITGDISLWDRKTRTLFWMDENTPSCAACRNKTTVSSIQRDWQPATRAAEPRKKAASR